MQRGVDVNNRVVQPLHGRVVKASTAAAVTSVTAVTAVTSARGFARSGLFWPLGGVLGVAGLSAWLALRRRRVVQRRRGGAEGGGSVEERVLLCIA